jgi:hypothetical protein
LADGGRGWRSLPEKASSCQYLLKVELCLVWCVIWVCGFPELWEACGMCDVEEGNVSGHLCSYTCCESSNLLLYVVQKCIGGPSAVFLDSDGVNSIEFHCHGPTCSQGVAADIVLGESKFVEPHLLDSCFECCVDVFWCDLAWLPWCGIIGANGGVGVIGVSHYVGHSSG